MKSKRVQMVSKFFLSFNDKGEMELQGQIIAEPRAGLFLCQLYEWIMGDPSDQRLIKLEEMLTWKFYDTHADWRFAAEQQMLRERRAKDDVGDCAPN